MESLLLKFPKSSSKSTCRFLFPTITIHLTESHRSGTANKILEAKEKERAKAKEPPKKKSRRCVIFPLRPSTTYICICSTTDDLGPPAHRIQTQIATRQILLTPILTQTVIHPTPTRHLRVRAAPLDPGTGEGDDRVEVKATTVIGVVGHPVATDSWLLNISFSL